jgi:uncharacterized protein YndB with AHSA1/START domain
MAVTSSGTAVVTLPTDTQILITRSFDAPKHLVYRAWTTPELIRRWWSGQRGEVTSVEIDLRIGGTWRYVMTANEGFEVAFHGEFLEIEPDERIVATEVYEDEEASAFAGQAAPVTTVTFSDTGGRTLLTQLTECGSPELRDAIIESGMEGGMQEAMDRLEEVAVSLR